ncbi:glycosyltransferase family 39 protein [Marinilongibacter aquaticus]|uniref:glycosyltransferase family 39 protein n=1 Tax=Marinilongibacter aquaticus TaxID=2975157 RepID=UPI0021BD5498|nr:glycosyltransferase family 39 protein [Marinilongibacter aquaticus]UBM57662.1 glycosyltransferase family 39 protein [Marinilongibacter aquaticus]
MFLTKRPSDYFNYWFLLLVAHVIPTGYLLSALNKIDKPLFWGLFLLLFGGLSFFFIQRNAEAQYKSGSMLFKALKQNFLAFWNGLSKLERWLFGSLLTFLAACSGINILVMCITYPNEWDSMTGHLVKCAYYLQNGNMGRVHGTTWSIDYYPNSLPTLQILGFHLIGEKGFKLIHYVSYWVFVSTTYSISKILFSNTKGAVFAAIVAALLPSALIQAVTTETDIVQSAYLGLVVWALLMVYKTLNWKNISLLVLAVSVWMSHKITFLLIGPAVAVLLVFLLFKRTELWSKVLPTLGLFLIGVAVFVLPNGYLGNLKEADHFSLGALSAPPEMMKWHGIESYSTHDKLKNFALNGLRYSSDFLQLDGIRNTEWGQKVNEAFRFLPNKLFSRFNLERKEFWVVYPFETMGNSRLHFYKERPYWGIVSFVLVLPIVLWLVFDFFRKRESREALLLPCVFVVAAAMHFMSLCYSAPYDPIKGRYFMNMAVWCVPLLAYFFVKKRGLKFLLACGFVIGITAVLTLSHRGLYPLVGENSVFKLNRIEQLNVTRPEGTEAYANFDKLVPEDAVVALGTQQEHEDYVYPLWGRHFKRTLIPIHPFRSPVKPVPKEADFLIYSEGVLPYQEGDIQLNKGNQINDTPVPESRFYLRKLKD